MNPDAESVEVALSKVFVNGVRLNQAGKPEVVVRMVYKPQNPGVFTLNDGQTQSAAIPFSQLGAIKTTYRPTTPVAVLMEFKKRLDFRGVWFILAQMEVQQLRALDRIMVAERAHCLPALKKGARSHTWLMLPPFNGVYTWRLSEIIRVVASVFQALMTVALCYEFFMLLPVIFTANIQHFIKNLPWQAEALIIPWYQEYPYHVLGASGIVLFFTWPMLAALGSMVFAVWLASSLVHLSIALSLYCNIIRTFKTIVRYVKMAIAGYLGLVNALNPRSQQR